jgi:hypothetical protein
VQGVTEAHPEVGFFQDIQQTGHWPPTHELGFEAENIGRFRLGLQRRELDPVFALRVQGDFRIGREAIMKTL